MIETKSVRESYKDYINDLTAFGWQPTSTERVGGRLKHTNQILARDMSIPCYNELRKCELEYEHAKEDLWPSVEIDASAAILLFLLLIIPGVLYLSYKSAKKDKVENHNAICRQKMKDAVRKGHSIY